MDWNIVWATLGGMAAIMSVYSGLFFWFMSRIENRLDAHISSTNVHFDAVNARIDQTQAVIMRMLEKRGM